jgi:Domain of unknown function (DUF6265)
MKVCISLLLFIPVLLYSQTNDFNWLTGKWKVQSATREQFEEWQMTGDRLKGEGYIIKEGQKQVSETLFLENFDGQWAYIAIPKKQNITLFALVRVKENSYIFENREHDFPQRLVYNYDGDITLKVAVEGIDADTSKNFELVFTKVHQP